MIFSPHSADINACVIEVPVNENNCFCKKNHILNASSISTSTHVLYGSPSSCVCSKSCLSHHVTKHEDILMCKLLLLCAIYKQFCKRKLLVVLPGSNGLSIFYGSQHSRRCKKVCVNYHGYTTHIYIHCIYIYTLYIYYYIYTVYIYIHCIYNIIYIYIYYYRFVLVRMVPNGSEFQCTRSHNLGSYPCFCFTFYVICTKILCHRQL